MTDQGSRFPTETSGLPTDSETQVIDLRDGDAVTLRVGPVAKKIGDRTVRMLAYNGSIPGTALRVEQDTVLDVDIENHGDLDTTVHWHGLRLENRYDGTHETQHPIAVGSSYQARVAFPDPGIYWYHPHIRQDYGQEMGLYGSVVVTPTEPDYWPAAHREQILTLDDILLDEEGVASFNRMETNYSAMGRFGDQFLINGETDLHLPAQRGEVVRFYLINTANTRVFNVAIPDARVKLVGGDSGRVEHEQFVSEVLIAPSERAVVDVMFDEPGQHRIEHHTPHKVHVLATIDVDAKEAAPSLDREFETLRTNSDLVAERQRATEYLDRAPDKTLAFLAEMDVEHLAGGAPPTSYACPMHPEVTSTEAGHCPRCGMALLPVREQVTSYACPMHPEVTSTEAGHCPECGMALLPAGAAGMGGAHEHDHHESMDGNEQHHEASDHSGSGHESMNDSHDSHVHGGDGIEWEDDMVEINRLTTPSNMRWKLVDKDTGAENAAIQWRFKVGDQVKIRLLNEMAGDHPMHHPFHVHGAGRFLVLSRDGTPESNLVWKDTVLVRTGETVDILLDVTNPGRWMAHCHIAEHHETGMMFSFYVDAA